MSRAGTSWGLVSSERDNAASFGRGVQVLKECDRMTVTVPTAAGTWCGGRFFQLLGWRAHMRPELCPGLDVAFPYDIIYPKSSGGKKVCMPLIPWTALFYTRTWGSEK